MIQNLTTILTCFVISLSGLVSQANDGIHLVMLTGDARMQNLDETVSFLPHLQTELAEDEVIVVKSAYQRKHLGHWHDGWFGNFRGKEIRDYAQGWILDEMIRNARAAVTEKEVQSITLVFANGTTDAQGGHSLSYKSSFQGIVNQLAKELGWEDLNCVIARLNRADEDSKRHPEWGAVRTMQQELGESLPHACWVDTDAIIDRSKDYSETFGKLLAEAAVKQIRGNADSEAAMLPEQTILKKRQPAHLFLLSGQSNMANLDPEEAFVPAVNTEFGEAEAIVVKAAYGAKSISHWYKGNENSRQAPANGSPDPRNWLYRELLGKTKFAIADRKIQSVTLCWMQGEADTSREASTNAYGENFKGLIQLLREDLGRDDINFVIGRLSDHSNPEKFPAWEQMREIQVKLAEDSPRGRWIDTDAWNGDDNNLHYPKGENGQIALAKAFAAQAIELALATEKKP